MIDLTPSTNHWLNSNYRERITRKKLHSMLLNGNDTIIRDGCLCDLKKRHLGVGVYEIWFEKRESRSNDRAQEQNM
jgi:hypothetical protein